MLTILVELINCILAWRFGDWRNWKNYQSTILYLITSDLLYNFLCYNYPLVHKHLDQAHRSFLKNH